MRRAKVGGWWKTSLVVYILGWPSICLATETVIVRLGTDGGEVRYRASGFLHAFRGDAPPDRWLVPLKVQLHRTSFEIGSALAERMKRLGIQQQIVISDSWGYAAVHPGDGGDWTKWEEFVAHMVKQARQRGMTPQWDIWNEPDASTLFWKRSPEQFAEMWRRACRKLRQLDPAAIVVGPSWSGVHPGDARFSEFLRYCHNQQVPPDYLSWHFWDSRNLLQEVEDCRKLLAELYIRVKGIMINEYCSAEEQYAGKTAFRP
jgi:hypothetical protein